MKCENGGLGRTDVIHLSAIDLSQILNEAGLSKTLTDALEGKGRR